MKTESEKCLTFTIFYILYSTILAHKLEEVYAQLDKSSSDIYIQRCKQLYQITPPRTKLLTWIMDSVEIVALADTSVHGKENVVKTMREIDEDRYGIIFRWGPSRIFDLIPPILFFPENVICSLHQVHFKLDFVMEANTMNPDQADRVLPWEQSNLGPYCLQYKLPKNISR